MKKLLSLVFVVALSTTLTFNAKAQESPVLAGAGLTYATELDGVGITLKGVYQITPQWEGAAAFTYFFKKDNVNWSSLDLDGHYVFHATDKALFYGLAGLNFLFWKIKHNGGFDYDYEYTILNKSTSASLVTTSYSDDGTEVGLNIGAGARVNLSDRLWLNPEIKYTIGDGDFLAIGVALLYNF
jgi:opacity protein-like surface antigen